MIQQVKPTIFSPINAGCAQCCVCGSFTHKTRYVIFMVIPDRFLTQRISFSTVIAQACIDDESNNNPCHMTTVSNM